MFKFSAYAYLLILTFLVSCGTAYIKTPITRPAEVNMSEYKKITIGEFKNTYDYNDRYFESKLQTEILKSKRFEVLDRKNIDAIMTEKGLQLDGLTKGNSNGLGSLISATAIITGTVIDQATSQNTTVEGTYKDKKGNMHTNYKTETTANATVAFIVTDLSSGKIIYNTEITENLVDKDFFQDRATKKVDSYKLLLQVKEKIAKEFLKKIIPYQDFVYIPFKRNSDKFDAGIKYAENGMLDKAKEFFETEIMKKHEEEEELSKAHFNLGLCNMYLYNFEEAKGNFETAEKVFHNEDYIDIFKQLEKLKEDRSKVLEQSK